MFRSAPLGTAPFPCPWERHPAPHLEPHRGPGILWRAGRSPRASAASALTPCRRDEHGERCDAALETGGSRHRGRAGGHPNVFPPPPVPLHVLSRPCTLPPHAGRGLLLQTDCHGRARRLGISKTLSFSRDCANLTSEQYINVNQCL